jgi:hypothetical protein
MRTIADVTGGKLIAVWSQSISGVSADNPLVAFNETLQQKIVIRKWFVYDITQNLK